MVSIEVRVPHCKLLQLEHEVHIANYTMQGLRKAGIPVVGALFPKEVENGSLTITNELKDLIFTWVGEQPLVKAEEEIW